MSYWGHKLSVFSVLTTSVVLFWFASAAGSCVAPQNKNYVLLGHVADEGGNVLVGASITAGQISATSGQDGNYSLTSQSPNVTVQVSAKGFSPITTPLNLSISTGNYLYSQLRPIDLVAQVTLPAPGQPSVTVQTSHGQGQSSLTIPPGSMRLPNGQVAQGTVQVTMTFWNPEEGLASIPGALFGVAPGGNVVHLSTYGMADIEITQNGQVLQVVQGQNLVWQVTEPPTTQAAVAKLDALAQPSLYYLDETSGLWVLANSPVTYEAQTGIFTALLPHLTPYNIDGSNAQYGGCTSGPVVDQCGNPLPNYALTLWFMTPDEIIEIPTQSDSAGTFCANTPADNPSASTNQTAYFVSGGGGLGGNASACEPIPNGCVAGMAAVSGYPGTRTTDCPYGPSSNYWPLSAAQCAQPHRPGPGITTAQCENNCAAQNGWITTIHPCAWCPGSSPHPNGAVCSSTTTTTQACSQVVKTVINTGLPCGQSSAGTSGGGNTTTGTGTGGTGSGTGGTGGRCTTPLLEGDPCDETKPNACCSTQLVCQDEICLPPGDPAATQNGGG